MSGYSYQAENGMANKKKEAVSRKKSTGQLAQVSLVLPLRDNVTSLSKALAVFEKFALKINHIESRRSKNRPGAFDFLAEISRPHEEELQQAIAELNEITVGPVEQHAESFVEKGYDKTVVSEDVDESKRYLPGFPGVPWFPQTLQELISHLGKTLQCGAELDADHPGFKDKTYRERRKSFADLSISYTMDKPIPKVEYTKEETETWGKVYRELTRIYPTHACSTYNEMFKLLEKECGYSDKAIPQFEKVSKFLLSRTGFRLRPISGLVDWRDYLAGLAFRVFHGTQYIRHADSPSYSPEPDVCHELLGHVPLFCDPVFAQFSQELGLASLGAPDEWIEKLGALYWYTVEFGVCREKSGNRAYGGALLSSFGELEHCLSEKAITMPLDTEKVAATPYPITRYQDVYFVAESFHAMRDQLAAWMTQIPRPFALRYNAYTDRVELLHERRHLDALARDIQTEVRILMDAINKL
ncbi:phenylalanine-4-hydroxylase-like isoform X2 [Paramacrobiotus metropolitanus]|nr:phenylalanine-4-hydroxylase-like isoform X2 [Paramacrobiotus metropolitanus]XP_055345110.1 phenylalanine-4-hydroxylase-like isoform X2 [Paramacrobiotus metropolitanus]XP_055345111.1 phenylalanine-4-hydroxylase-like isoform X2 [Paramacrobiotus metropolitanus]